MQNLYRKMRHAYNYWRIWDSTQTEKKLVAKSHTISNLTVTQRYAECVQGGLALGD